MQGFGKRVDVPGGKRKVRRERVALAAAATGKVATMKSTGTKKRRKNAGSKKKRKRGDEPDAEASENSAAEPMHSGPDDDDTHSDILGISKEKSVEVEKNTPPPPRPRPRPRPRPVRKVTPPTGSPGREISGSPNPTSSEPRPVAS